MKIKVPALRSAESIHAYDFEGTPVPRVPRAKPIRHGFCENCRNAMSTTARAATGCRECGRKNSVEAFEVDRFVPTTTAHMAKYGLFVSVSRVATYGEAPFDLTKWAKDRLANYVMDSYRVNRTAWMQNINSGLNAMENGASERGTSVHSYIQKTLDGDDPIVPAGDVTLEECLPAIVRWVNDYGFLDVETERCYCDPVLGMAGTVDFVGTSPDQTVIADFKTKMNPKAFAEMARGSQSRLWAPTKQLAAYAALRGGIDSAYVVPICNTTGDVAWTEIHPDKLRKGKKAVLASVDAFYANMQFDPREMHADGKSMRQADIIKTP